MANAHKYRLSAGALSVDADILIPIDRRSSLPLYEQIAQQLALSIQKSRLARGARLPSIRQLAGKLGVSPFTTVTAYDQLIAMGLIVSRAASGFFVADAPAKTHVTGPEVAGAEGRLNAVWLTRCALEAGHEWTAAGSSFLPAHWLQDLIPGSLIQKVLRNHGDELFKPVPAQGSFPLRELLSTYLRRKNIFADPNSILVTDGTTQAIDLICKALLKAGQTVVAEVPGSPLLFSRLREHGVHVVSLQRGQEGLDVRALEALCKVRPPKIVFTQSALHDPTGWSSSISNLHRLLTLAEHYDFLIAENDVHGDLALGTTARLAQLSELKNVLYYSSFTKTMGPLVRLGFIAAEPHKFERLLNAKIHSATRCSCFNECIVAELLGSRHYHKGVEQLRLRLEKARASTLALLSDIGIRFDAPGDGLFLWGRLSAHVDMDLLVRDAYSKKILLAHGSLFQPGVVDRADHTVQFPYLRFNVAHSNRDKLAHYLENRLVSVSVPSSRLMDVTPADTQSEPTET